MDFFKRLEVPEVWHVGESDATTAACAGALFTTAVMFSFGNIFFLFTPKHAGRSQNSEEPKGCRKPVPMLECWTRRVRQEQVDASFASQHLGEKDGPTRWTYQIHPIDFFEFAAFLVCTRNLSYGENMSLYESALAVKGRFVGFQKLWTCKLMESFCPVQGVPWWCCRTKSLSRPLAQSLGFRWLRSRGSCKIALSCI